MDSFLRALEKSDNLKNLDEHVRPVARAALRLAAGIEDGSAIKPATTYQQMIDRARHEMKVLDRRIRAGAAEPELRARRSKLEDLLAGYGEKP